MKPTEIDKETIALQIECGCPSVASILGKKGDVLLDAELDLCCEQLCEGKTMSTDLPLREHHAQLRH